MTMLRTSLVATRQAISIGGDQSSNATQAEQRLPAGAALVAGTLLRQHQRAGGGEDVHASLIDAVTRLWQAIGQGDVCLPLSRAADNADGTQNADAKLLMDLKRSPVVMVDPVGGAVDGAAADIRPLVISNGRLSTYRYWLAEHVLARNLIAMAGSPLLAASADRESVIDGSLGKAQREAVELASRRRLLILTGGPGTGKTHTLAAIVRAAVAAASQRANSESDETGAAGAIGSPFAIAVAAPTGKATARISSAIESAISDKNRDRSGGAPADQSNVLLEAMTLHRLLGLNASSAREQSDTKLPFDLIVIDESSMVDTLMAARLLSSLRGDTQLIFAGDRDQLASVQAGAFFGTLCTTSDERIAACRIALDQNYRQKEAPEILAWADGVRTGQLTNVPSGEQVRFDSGGSEALIKQTAQRFRPLVAAATNADEGDCVSLIQQYLQVQVLAMLRTGSEGVDALNESIGLTIRESVRQSVRVSARDGDRWFAGRLVVVRKNAAHRGLFNGDIGLCVSLPDGGQRALRVAFEQPDGSARYVLPSQMPSHEDAWALTVHQAQGSDFGQVLFLPAPAGHALATREGIYTAITRARKQITIFGGPEDIAAAAARPGSRESGLMDALIACQSKG